MVGASLLDVRNLQYGFLKPKIRHPELLGLSNPVEEVGGFIK